MSRSVVRRGLGPLTTDEGTPRVGSPTETAANDGTFEWMRAAVKSAFGSDVIVTVHRGPAKSVSAKEAAVIEDDVDHLDWWKRRLQWTCRLCGMKRVVDGRCTVCGAPKAAP